MVGREGKNYKLQNISIDDCDKVVAIGELWSSLPGNDLLVTRNDERPLYS